MTVAELIALLHAMPQDAPVAYRCFSEHCLMEAGDIGIEMLCELRSDGWIQDARPDKPSRQYVVLPGN